jgi:hypothetical protein
MATPRSHSSPSPGKLRKARAVPRQSRGNSSQGYFWIERSFYYATLSLPVGWNAIKLGLLIFQAMWLLLVLPGHTRGLISWTRSSSGVEIASESCCGSDQASPRSTDDEPTREQKKNCAVCYYAVGLTPPPVLELYVPDLGLLQILPLLPAPMHAEQEHLLTYYACGPPIMA